MLPPAAAAGSPAWPVPVALKAPGPAAPCTSCRTSSSATAAAQSDPAAGPHTQAAAALAGAAAAALAGWARRRGRPLRRARSVGARKVAGAPSSAAHLKEPVADPPSAVAPEIVATIHAEAAAHAEAGAVPASGGGAFAEKPEKGEAVDPYDAWGAFGRFVAAGWETFLGVAVAKDHLDSKKKGWDYRKGIEGMSMGSLHYEMLNTSENTETFASLQKEYEKGWNLPFVNMSFRKISASLRDGSKALGLDGVWLTFVNLLETFGVPGELIDGIPVQNKWMTIVRNAMVEMGKQDSAEGQKQMNAMVQNMVTGHMERIAGAPMPIFLEAYGECAGIFKIVIGPRSCVVISDPVIVKQVLQSSQENYTKGILSEVLEPIMGKGLIPADPVTWKLRRRAISPGFHKQWLKETVDIINSCATRLTDDIEQSISLAGSSSYATVNMEEKFTSVSLDLIGKAVFDYDFGSVERESPMVRAVFAVLREAERRAQSVVPYWNLPGASSVFRDQKLHEENLMLLNAVLDELVRNAVDSPPSEDGHLSLLQYLVVTKNQDVSQKQLRDDLMTLLIAGHETTAALLTWTLHELMKPCNRRFLDQVLDEMEAVLGDRAFQFEDMPKMPVLKYVLLETLRLYPEPPLLIRRCVEGDEVAVGPLCKGVSDKVSMLPGQDIFISTWSLQRSTQLWGENAAEFDPLRWQRPIEPQGRWGGYRPEKANGLYPNEIAADFAFLPFGGGPRKCIGDNFALLEAEVVLTSILRKFTFTPSAKQEVGMTTGATIHTTGGLLVDIRRRDPADRHAHQRAPQVIPATLPKRMEKMTTVAQRIEPQALVVPTPAELLALFAEQVHNVKYDGRINTEAVEAAYTQCREVTQEYSKTFYLGSQLLDRDEQRGVWAIYNWCRSTDELVDGPLAKRTTMADLEAWEERLERTFAMGRAGASLDPAIGWEDLSLVDSIQRFSLIQRPFQDMVGGMAMDLVKTRYETFKELEVYCYRVAGTVGLMTLPILGFDGLQNFTEELQEQTIAAAMSLGMAFQLTNILRDVGEDGRRDRIYVPREDLLRFGITEEELLAACHTPGLLYHEDRWRDFMEFQIERCQRYYKEAEAGIVGLSEVNRLGVMAALLVYGAILEAVRTNKYDNFSRRAYVPLSDKIMLMGKAWWRVQQLQELAQQNVRSGRIFTRRAKTQPVPQPQPHHA